MTTLTLILVALQVSACFAELPNYITDDEFTNLHIHNVKIEPLNTTLPLPKYDQSFPERAFGPRSRLWTNAQVPYTLDSAFTAEQREQVALAIKAFHDSTCIRFVPKADSHTSWVNILYDSSSNACGVAQLCMGSGGQFAKFGGGCVSAGTMVHELGHTLCMGHEQTRHDRDEWISFNTQKCEPHKKDHPDFTNGLHKLYDYVSIEHYEGECYNGCFQPKQPGVTKCGSGGPLSVLDIEILNEMYDCNSGCLGYRYVNSNSQLKNPVEAGQELSGDKLYSCRAYHQGDIIPGKYHLGRKECHVAYNGAEHSKRGDRIEVLTNPHNVRLGWIRTHGDTLARAAIRGGRTHERETLYVVRCQIDVNGRTTWMPGKFQPSTGAYTSYGGREIKCPVSKLPPDAEGFIM